MKVTVKGNIAEQIKRGIEPQESMVVDVDLSALTEEQRGVLAKGDALTIVESTQSAVADALQAILDAERARVEQEAEAQRRRDEEMRKQCMEATPNPVQVTEIGDIKWTRHDMPYLSTWMMSPDVAELVEATRNRLQAEIDKLNTEAKAAVQPIIDAELERRAKAEEEEKARKKAELESKKAKRLETGIVEISFERGNRRDWGEPWIAKLKSGNGKRPDYDFSAGSYDAATEVLTIPCKPGEIIAYGQKNYSKPKKTIHTIRKMVPDGGLVEA